jgi:hypothetical protein
MAELCRWVAGKETAAAMGIRYLSCVWRVLAVCCAVALGACANLEGLTGGDAGGEAAADAATRLDGQAQDVVTDTQGTTDASIDGSGDGHADAAGPMSDAMTSDGTTSDAMTSDATTSDGTMFDATTSDGATSDATTDTGGLEAGPTGLVIATNQAGVYAMAADSDGVYWSRPSAGIVQVYSPGDGGLVEVAIPSAGPYGVAIGPPDSGVFFADGNNGVLWSCGPGCSSTPTEAMTGLAQPRALAVAGAGTSFPGTFFWSQMDESLHSNGPDFALVVFPPSGVTNQAGIASVAVGELSAYWTDALAGTAGSVQAVQYADLPCSAPVSLAAGQQDSPIGIVTDGLDVFWVDQGAGTVMTLTNNTPQVVLSGQSAPTSIAVAAGNLYWTNNGTSPSTATGSVVKCPEDFCSAATLAVIATGQPGPTVIAVDAQSVYWANEGDVTVRKAPR